MEQTFMDRLEKLEKNNRRLRVAFIGTILIFFLFAIVSFKKGKPDTDEILKVKGLVIVDEKGNPRIAMGAPLHSVQGRKRNDDLVGILYLDSNGIDRLTIGQNPPPMTGEGIMPRRVEGAGVIIHDKEGVERGGFGVSDDGMAILAVDWPKTGEAIALSSGKDFSGIGLFYKSKPGIYREAITYGTIASNGQTFLKIIDTNNIQRLRFELNGTNWKLKKFDDNGKLLPE